MRVMKKQRLVVIGNGMAGMRTVEEVLSAAPGHYDITMLGDEPYGHYNRVLLSSLLCGEKSLAEIVTHDRSWYRDHGITLHAGADKAVIEIQRGLRRVITRDGTVAEYDRLLIATGSRPVMPEIPGVTLKGVIGFRDVLDVDTMLSYARKHRNAVVVGGGLLGLEAANGLSARGMKVTVVHSQPVLLNRQLDAQAAVMLQAEFEARGLEFKMAAQLQALIGDDLGHVRGATFGDGSELDCDLCVMAIGIRPNTVLARQAGLYCERGIVVNDTLQTYDPSIYAVGECIQHRGATFGLVAPLFEQAKVCANHLCAHGVAEYVTLPTATKLKVSGIHLFSVGDFIGDEHSQSIRYVDSAQGVYKKLVIEDNKLRGAVLYGDTADGVWYQDLLEQRQDIAGVRESLIFGKAYASA